MTFVSYKEELEELLPHLVSNIPLHVKWLNTLSFLENCGARKIAACEHPTKVQKEMLKHASEEFRHAFYLKSQVQRIFPETPLDYSLENMVGGIATLQYLNRLDLESAKILKARGLDKRLAYIFVTYAIELRADELYPIYREVLKSCSSPITVTSILLEEEEHLAEMERELALIPDSQELADQVIALEGVLCQKWLGAVKNDLSLPCVL